ncbi:MAG TPA: hypothetical protein VKN63_08775 [Afifellaceae bacterium]|nr:hypothetical protein [Afifellaceae bacterium]
MMPIEDFVAELAELDVRLSVDGERLNCSAPNEVMNSDLQSRLAERKSELMAFLTGVAERAKPAVELVRMPAGGDIVLSPGMHALQYLHRLPPQGAARLAGAGAQLVGNPAPA